MKVNEKEKYKYSFMYMNTVSSLAQANLHFKKFILILYIWILPACNSIQVSY